MTPKRCALYRHFDADDLLLYLGISDNPVQRGKDHARDSDWVKYAVRAEVVWYRNRAAAERAEKIGIIAERPIFNRQHNDYPGAGERRKAYIEQRIALKGWSTIDAGMDGLEWWKRKIHTDIDDAAQVTLNRDSYVDHHMGRTDPSLYELRNRKTIEDCARVGLEAIWAVGYWHDRTCDIAATNRYAYLYVPDWLVNEAIQALIAADGRADDSKLVALTAELTQIAAQGGYEAPPPELPRFKDACHYCTNIDDRCMIHDPLTVEPNGPTSIRASYRCHNGHEWTRGYRYVPEPADH